MRIIGLMLALAVTACTACGDTPDYYAGELAVYCTDDQCPARACVRATVDHAVAGFGVPHLFDGWALYIVESPFACTASFTAMCAGATATASRTVAVAWPTGAVWHEFGHVYRYAVGLGPDPAHKDVATWSLVRSIQTSYMGCP